MDKQNEQVDGFLPEIVAAFRDLTHLTHRGIDPTTDAHPTVGAELLKRLLLLCQAARGAIFLTIPSPADSELLSFMTMNGKVFRLIALHDVYEEDAQKLFSTFSSESLWTSAPAQNPSWLHWRLRLTLSFPFQLAGKSKEQEPSALPTTLYAYLLFGWDQGKEEDRAAAMEKARMVLPLIADAVGMVIVRAFTSEYIKELEVSADRKPLREMELLKAELLATVSHELRSPLASIKGYAATLLRHDRRISREERREFLLAINQSSDRLAGVIDSLLEMSEFETESIEIQQTSVNVARLVREAVGVAEEQLEGSEEAGGLTPSGRQYPTFIVRLEDHHGEPTHDELIIEADSNRLREVLDHLLQNAVIHAPEGGIIDVTIRPVFSLEDIKQFPLASPESARKLIAIQQRYQQLIVISVRDNGMGIPTRHLTRIFEPFYRVDIRLTRETSGLGLGLAISRRIVELHDGVLWVESEIGRGSTFYVCLPIHGVLQSEKTEHLREIV